MAEILYLAINLNHIKDELKLLQNKRKYAYVPSFYDGQIKVLEKLLANNPTLSIQDETINSLP